MNSELNNSRPSETIVFYHLPKTAGTTLNAILRQNYGSKKIVSPGIDTHAFMADFSTWPQEKRREIWLLQGHFPYGIHELLPQPSRCFTILRDPIARTISYYYHALRDSEHYLHALIHKDKMSLKMLIESGAALMMNDGQTRLLSAVWGDAPVGGVTDEMLNTAVSNLNAMTLVGLTEQFDTTLLLLQHTFGWQNIYYTRQNVAANRAKAAPIDQETLATIIHYNQQDWRLYHAAQERFNEQIAAFGPLLRARLAAFQLKHKYHHFSWQYYWQKITSARRTSQ
jgi:hypothetical protein